MDAFPKMFQNTFFIVEQQVTHIEWVIMSSQVVQRVKVSIILFYESHFNSGIKIMDIEPTTDGKMGLEDDLLCCQPLTHFLLCMLPCNF